MIPRTVTLQDPSGADFCLACAPQFSTTQRSAPKIPTVPVQKTHCSFPMLPNREKKEMLFQLARVSRDQATSCRQRLVSVLLSHSLGNYCSLER